MTKSALGIDPAEYGVSDPQHAWRIRKAQREAERRELVMLRKDPERRFFIRNPIPFEENGWVADEHKQYSLVLVRVLAETNQLHRMMMRVDASTVLDTEDFCRALYYQACPSTENGSGSTFVSVEEHAALLEAAGIQITRGGKENAHG